MYRLISFYTNILQLAQLNFFPLSYEFQGEFSKKRNLGHSKTLSVTFLVNLMGHCEKIK